MNTAPFGHTHGEGTGLSGACSSHGCLRNPAGLEVLQAPGPRQSNILDTMATQPSAGLAQRSGLRTLYQSPLQ